MALAFINISAKQYFNFMCRTDFERRIFHDTYKEFQKKSKAYNVGESLHTFSQMIKANLKAKNLHQKLHYTVMGTIETLKNKMPILADVSGKPLLFEWAELQIAESDLLNKAAHIVTLTYTSPKLVLHEIVNDILILSYDKKGEFNQTFMLKTTNKLMINYEQTHEVVYG
ncbi:hypothetical protein [Pedobacter sp. Leaf250]|uniref:hypothetical protein n=1 Tax=Pedobacter sp. Leaf250 TaxID=2876559 RepID=UPI001E2D98F3|nr:hypothetical protein [Pedobacter sp. Leaf250]